jgi:hypothetical protein
MHANKVLCTIWARPIQAWPKRAGQATLGHPRKQALSYYWEKFPEYHLVLYLLISALVALPFQLLEKGNGSSNFKKK